jgi:hypothetical protein
LGSIRRTAERLQQQVELRLQLCDSNELDAQLPFGAGKALINAPEATRRQRRVEPRGKRARWCQEFIWCHDGHLQSRERMPEVGRTAVLKSTSASRCLNCPIKDIPRAALPVRWR